MPGLDDNHVDQVVEGLEVVSVAGVEGKSSRQCDGCDKKVHSPCSSRSLSSGRDSGEDSTVGARRVGVEWQRLERRLSALKTVLPATPLIRVARNVGTGCKFSQRDRADRYFDRKIGHLEFFEIDDDRRVKDASRRLTTVAHCDSVWWSAVPLA